MATFPFKSGEDNKSLQLRFQGDVFTPNGNKVQAGMSAVCVMCHANKRDADYRAAYAAGKQSRGPHGNTQSDVLYGFGAFDFGKAYENSPHKDKVREGCVSCHMARSPIEDPGPDGKPGTKDDLTALSVGGHSFEVAADWTTKDKSVKAFENIAVCQECHKEAQGINRPAKDDYDGDGKVEGVQDEVEGLLNLLASKLSKDDKGAVLAAEIDKKVKEQNIREALSGITHWSRMTVAVGSITIHTLSRYCKTLTSN